MLKLCKYVCMYIQLAEEVHDLKRDQMNNCIILTHSAAAVGCIAQS